MSMKVVREAIATQKQKHDDLIRQFPFLEIKNSFNKPVNTVMTWNDAIPAGWHKSFSNRMWGDLRIILERHNYLNKFVISNINTFNGTLYLEYLPVPEALGKELDKWEKYYQGECMLHCHMCGEWTSSVALSDSVYYICDHCAHENSQFDPNHVYPLSWRNIPREFACKDLTDPCATDTIIEHPLSDQMKEHWKKGR